MQTARSMQPSNHHLSNGARLVAVDGRELPLVSAALDVTAGAGIARTTLRQQFRNDAAEPLRVTYRLPLPADGAVAAYSFTIGGRRIRGVVDVKERARERFVRAISEGRTAAILDQERDGLFTQELGNVPPGEAIEVELGVDQPLLWNGIVGGWELRFPTVAAPRYLGGPGRTPDAARVTVDVADAPLPVRCSLALQLLDAVIDGHVESSSHALTVESRRGVTHVSFGDARGVRLDRDVVVRWQVAAQAPGASVQLCRPAAGSARSDTAFGLVTLVPPLTPGKSVARDLVLLLDVSGSMSGRPLAQLQKISQALIRTLGPQDSLELISFADEPRHFTRAAVRCDPDARERALAFISKLQASGSTEMRRGIEEALKPLRGDAERQIVLMTDGHIGAEREVVAHVVQALPKGSVLHTVGVGSGVNRSLTGPAARAGRGLELIVDLDDDGAKAAERLVAATDAPALVQLQLEGSALRGAPVRIPSLYAGRPVLVPVELATAGGTLRVKAERAGGRFLTELQVEATAPGEGLPAIAALWAREQVAGLELAIAGGADQRAIDPQIEALGTTFQIATRRTSFVAVSDRVEVEPGTPEATREVPQELPYGLDPEGLGLGTPRLAAAPVVQRVAAAPMGPPGLAAGVGAALGRMAKSVMGAFEPEQEERKKEKLDEAPARRQRAAVVADEDAFEAEAAPAGAADEGLVERVSVQRSTEERADAPAPAELPAPGGGWAPADDEAAAPPPTPAAKPAAPAPPKARSASPRREADKGAPTPQALRVLTALLASLGGDLRVLEAKVEGVALAFRVPATVEATLADGSKRTLRTDAARSTKAGEIPVGRLVRLVLIGAPADVVAVEWPGLRIEVG